MPSKTLLSPSLEVAYNIFALILDAVGALLNNPKNPTSIIFLYYIFISSSIYMGWFMSNLTADIFSNDKPCNEEDFALPAIINGDKIEIKHGVTTVVGGQ